MAAYLLKFAIPPIILDELRDPRIADFLRDSLQSNSEMPELPFLCCISEKERTKRAQTHEWMDREEYNVKEYCFPAPFPNRYDQLRLQTILINYNTHFLWAPHFSTYPLPKERTCKSRENNVPSTKCKWLLSDKAEPLKGSLLLRINLPPRCLCWK